MPAAHPALHASRGNPHAPLPDAMTTPALFHWSPTSRRPSIQRLGLVPGREHVTHSPGWRAPYVCLAENPRWAWALSGALKPEVESWDLWQVWLGLDHKIRRLKNFEPRDDRRYYEWRVYDRIFKRGVWLVGSRVLEARRG